MTPRLPLSPSDHARIAGQSVLDIVQRTASHDRSRTALLFERTEWTYGGLLDASRALAGGLRERGIGAGDRVLCLGYNSDRYVLAWLACHFVGAVHVPANYMLGAAEIAYLLEHAGPRAVLADTALAEVVESALREDERPDLMASLCGDAREGWVPFEALSAELDRLHSPAPEDIAQIAYTSGTESAPKGAMLSHGALVSQYTSAILAGSFGPDDVVLHSLPLYHCAQMHAFLMPQLWLGARNVVLPGADPGAMIEAIERHGITSVFSPPTVWIGILRHPDFDPARLSSVKKGYYGASIMPVEVIRELLDTLPGLGLWNLYGQTELCPVATVLRPEEQLERPGSAGRPVLNVETMVVDDELRAVGTGEVGEIVHRSSQLFSGYLDDPEKTAEAFSGGWFHSGDLATVDEDGFITIVDRKKDVIKSGGENVSSREVEETLYEHPAVTEVAVVGVPDPKWIEGVCAVIVVRPESEPTEEEIAAFARERLAGFKVPKRVVFVEALPKSASGKILKRELRDRLASGDDVVPRS
jgi:fatty-acyl-CoA synthase